MKTQDLLDSAPNVVREPALQWAEQGNNFLGDFTYPNILW